jgi:hypothetical protein
MTVEAHSGATVSAGLAKAHARMLADPSLQFTFKPIPQPKPPPWAKALVEFITAIAPVLMWLFWALVAAGVILIVFLIVREAMRVRWPERFGGKKKPKVEPEEWRPTAAQALALLEDVDKLAAQGRFAEAVHLLLFRSIQDIQGKRPNLVRPALTSRDISGLSALPEAARRAFGGIAQVVERSHFGGRPVDKDDFAACRDAYEAFAFPEVWA